MAPRPLPTTIFTTAYPSSNPWARQPCTLTVPAPPQQKAMAHYLALRAHGRDYASTIPFRHSPSRNNHQPSYPFFSNYTIPAPNTTNYGKGSHHNTDQHITQYPNSHHSRMRQGLSACTITIQSSSHQQYSSTIPSPSAQPHRHLNRLIIHPFRHDGIAPTTLPAPLQTTTGSGFEREHNSSSPRARTRRTPPASSPQSPNSGTIPQANL